MAVENILDPDMFCDSNHPQSKVHLLPCKIHYDGPANMEYFIETKTQETQLTSTLRGRKLVGKEMEMPLGYSYSIITQQKDQSWKVVGKGSNLTVWEHDDEPNGYNCAAMNLNDWVKISEALHRDVTPE